jgi:hypothetical protein
MAQLPTFIFAAPTLSVVTIAQDDQMRHTGVMWLSESMATYVAGAPVAWDYMSQFKLLVSYNGLPVAPSSQGCYVIEKDKYNPVKSAQGTWENLRTVPVDVTQYFVCKFRWGAPGVGVVDVYWIGPTTGGSASIHISDYVLVVYANYAVGRNTVYGSDIQDICLLGWQMSGSATPQWVVTKPDGTEHWIYADPMGGWRSCESLALMQKDLLGIPIPWT